MRIYKVLRAVIISVAVGTTAHPADAGVNNRYARWHMFQPFGYTDKIVGQNQWHVKGLGYYPPRGFMNAMVFHRAAMLAKASNFSYFTVVSFSETCATGGGANWWWKTGPGSCDDSGLRDRETHLTILGTDGTGSTAPCETANPLSTNCRLEVAYVLRDTAGVLGLTPDQEEQELSEIRRGAAKSR